MSKLKGFLILAGLLMASGSGAAQEGLKSAVAAAELPDAPEPAWMSGAGGQTGAGPQVNQQGRIDGVVLDLNEGIVAGAKVMLKDSTSAAERETTSDSAGRFSFTGLAGGRYTVTVSAAGLMTYRTSEVALKPGEHRELPKVALPLASARADVTVTVTEQEIAEEQVTAEIHQRVLGVLPNFYVSYIWNAAPLTPRQKYRLALHSALDPTEFLGALGQAGAEQYAGTYAGYGDDAAGFGKRFAASYGDGAIARMIGSAVLPSILHQDPRYFYLGTGTKKSRALYAVRMAVLSKSDSGKLQPAYSYIGGAFAAGAIANAYHPHADRGAGLVITNGFLDIAGHAVQNLIREFVTRGLTKGVPDYENGKASQIPPAK